MMKFLVICMIFFNISCLCDNLKSLVVVFRHGARTPIDPYPNDPYKNASYWPVGFGQLTDDGIRQEFMLGQWLKERYPDFIPSKYSEKDIHVISTDVDRTLMSAEACLAGLYPPEKDIIPNLNWRPIPIHTKPEIDDEILAMHKPCPLYDKLYKQLNKMPYFRNLTRKYHDLYAYLTRYSGTVVNNPDNVEYLYNTLSIEKSFNFTLPQWAQKVFPEKMEYLAQLSFALDAYTTELARLKTGPFFYQLIEYFQNITKGNEPKIRIYSAHDTTIANVLNSMKLFDLHSPPFSATILFELRQKNDSNFYLNLFYKNSSVGVNRLLLNGCEFDCDLRKFTEIMKNITLSSDEWAQACIVSWFDFLPFGHRGNIVAISFILSFTLISMFLLCGVNRLKEKRKSEFVVYEQLASEET